MFADEGDVLQALELADGVNIRRTRDLGSQLEQIAAVGATADFEISVLDSFDRFDLAHETGGDCGDLLDAGVDRRIVTVSDQVDLAGLAALGERLA